MVNEVDQFSETVGLIYEAALDPDKWPIALQSLCNELSADKAQMLYLDPNEHMISFACGYGFDPYAHNIGAGRFRRYLLGDPVAQYGITHLNEVFSDRRVIEPEVLHASSMHQEIRRPANMEYLLTSFLTDGTTDWSGICFFRRENQDAFNAEDEQLLTRYTPHMRRATCIHKTVAGSAQANAILNSVFDQIHASIIVVDDLHDIVLCNKSAQETIESTGIIRIKGTRLTCRHPRDNALLHQAIDEALFYKEGESHNRRIAIRLRGLNESQPILAVTTQLQVQQFEEKRQSLPITTAHYTARIPSRKNALLTFCNPERHKSRTAQMLESMFELTPAEAALADCLADDRSLNEAANILGRSVGTARVQLQSIFEKTDTNRQSSLVRLIMAVP